jgi:hypothetical protein
MYQFKINKDHSLDIHSQNLNPLQLEPHLKEVLTIMHSC